MVNADVIQKIVSDTTSEIEGYENANIALQNNIDELSDKILAVKEGICDIAAMNLQNYMTTIYCTNGIMYTSSSYNQSYDSTGNISDWRVLNPQLGELIPEAPSFNIVDELIFNISEPGDYQYLFVKHPSGSYPDIGVAFYDSTTQDILNMRFGNIDECIYDATTDLTTVIVSGIDMTSSDCNIIYLYLAEYNDITTDSTAVNLILDWNSAQDYMIHPLGYDGTYGLIPQKDMLTIGLGVNQSNKDKSTEVQTIFSKYASTGTESLPDVIDAGDCSPL